MGMDPHPATPTTGSVIFRHKKAGFLDILSLIFRKKSLNSYGFIETNGSAPVHGGDPSQAPLIALILVVQKALDTMSTPMLWAGIIIEFLLNFFSLNNGIFGLIKRFITCSVVIPDREDANYRSILGYVDDRTTLYKSNALINFMPSVDSMHTQFDGINIPDLSIMSAKISYENEAYIKKAVTDGFKVTLCTLTFLAYSYIGRLPGVKKTPKMKYKFCSLEGPFSLHRDLRPLRS